MLFSVDLGSYIGTHVILFYFAIDITTLCLIECCYGYINKFTKVAVANWIKWQRGQHRQSNKGEMRQNILWKMMKKWEEFSELKNWKK